MSSHPPPRAAAALLDPVCPHRVDCGACAMLGIPYEEQLRKKRESLGRELSKHDLLSGAKLLDCLPSPLRAGYRNRAKMAIGLPKRGGALVGYFRWGSREIVDAPDCKVLLPQLLDTTRRLRKVLERGRGIPRELRHLDLRCGSDPKKQHLTLVFRAEKSPRFPLDALREACPRVNGISVNLNPSAGSQVLHGAIRPVWGEREVWVEHAGLRMRVSPGAFFQANLALLAAIQNSMAEFLGEGGVLADLYAGVGTHGLALRKHFSRVLFVEGVRSAVSDLKATIRAHGISGCEIVARSVERSLDELAAEAPDAVILNPSRAGADERVLQAIGATPAAKIAYLSCEPATLCRDLVVLAGAGFETISIQPIDMMPQTGQVEALALLRRAQKAATPRPVARDGATSSPRAGKRVPRAPQPGRPRAASGPRRPAVGRPRGPRKAR